jgi:putative oxidoreductase
VSTNEASLEAPLNGTLWVLQLLGAILSFIVGFAKLSGDERMVQMFTAVGIGQWFRHVTGLSEVASAILLLVVPIMIGVFLTQLLISGGNPALPIGLLMIASIAAWGRKETTLRLIWHNDPKSVRQATNAFSEVHKLHT